jgi:hypothetical protein
MPPHKRDRRRSWRSFYVWHRWLGVSCALLVIWLAATGILLNHSSQFGLDRHYVQSAWLLRAYGVKSSPPERGYPLNGHWLTQASERLFLDTQPIAKLTGELLGVVLLQDVIVAASANSVLLLTRQGEVMEVLGRESLPGVVRAISSHDQQLLLRTSQGIFSSTADLARFVPYQGPWPDTVAVALPLPTAVADGIALSDSGDFLSRERVLTDLHSGRLFGRFGPLVMDAAALGFIFLALSGLWLWWRHQQSQRRRRQRHPD